MAFTLKISNCEKPVKLWKLLHSSCKQRSNQSKAILVVAEKLGNHCNICFQLSLSLQQLLEGSDVDTVRYPVSEDRAIANFTDTWDMKHRNYEDNVLKIHLTQINLAKILISVYLLQEK